MKINFINNILRTVVHQNNQKPIKNNGPQNQLNTSKNINTSQEYIKLNNYNYIVFSGSRGKKEEKEAIYGIDAYGNYIKFANIDEAASDTGIDKNKILQCVEGEAEYAKEFVFALASDIEENTRNGNQPDSMMLKLAADVIKSCCKNKKVFESIGNFVANNPNSPQNKEKAKAMKTGEGENDFTLKNIPKEDLTDKIKEKYEKSSFYVMDKSGKYKKFFRQAHVAHALGVDNRVVYKCLNGKQQMLNGLALAYARDIESKNEKGKIDLNLDKLKNKFKQKEGIYSVDKTGTFRKFDTPDDVVSKLNISKASLLSCLLGKQDVTSEHVFFKAKDLEIKNPDGSISIDEAKINEAKSKITCKAIYTINRKGEYKRYNSQAEAAKAIGATHGAIYMCLAGQRKTIHGYIIIPASEIERYTEDGRLIINTGKIKQILNNSIQLEEPINVRENGFYAINKDGDCRKFYSVKSAGKELKGHLTSISNCLKGLRGSAGGYIYVLAEEIEIKKENGEIELDKAKIMQKLAVLEGNPLYSIDKNGKCRRFNNQKEASAALNVSFSLISKCLTGKQKATSEYAFMYANEIELEEQDGEQPLLNWELIKEKVIYLNRQAIYAIDKDGNYKRFSTRDDASNALEINPKTLAGCLCGNSKTAKGYAFISANEVEDYLEDGTVNIDEEKIKSMTKMFNTKGNTKQ